MSRLCFCFGLVLGCTLCAFWSFSLSSLYWIAGIHGFGGLLCLRFSAQRLACGLLGLSIGIALAVVPLRYYQQQLIQAPTSQEAIVRIASIPREDNKIWRLQLQRADGMRLDGRIAQELAAPQAGEQWRVQWNLRPLAIADYTHNPRDAVALAEQRRIGRATIMAAEKLAEASSFQQWRTRKVAEISQRDSPYRVQGLVAALVTGERGQMNDYQWQTLRATGTSHLLAISGLHIGICAGWIFIVVRWFAGWLCGWLHRSFPAPDQIAAVAALFGAGAYAMLAGGSLPTQRAMIMLSVLMLAKIWRRAVWRWNGWSLAMILVLIFQPLSVGSIGFWLSFGAVALLFLIAQYGISWRMWLFSAIQTQLLISIALLPISMTFFGVVSWVSPLANLFAIPWVSVMVMPFALLGMFASTLELSSIAQWCCAWADIHLLACWRVLTWLQHLPWASQSLYLPRAIAMVMLLCLLLFFIFWRRWIWWKNSFFVLLIGFLCWLSTRTEPLPIGEARWSVFPIGEGLATLIQTRNHHVLFDVGSRWGNVADRVLIPALQGLGVRRLDALVLSHSDMQHIGGFAAIRAAFPIQQIYAHAELVPDLPGSQHCGGESWQWDGVEFSWLALASSCALQVSVAGQRWWLTADLAESELESLAQWSEEQPVTILLMPNQGRSKLQPDNWLQRMAPQLTLWSTAQPAAALIQSHAKLGIPWQNAHAGQITFTSQTPLSEVRSMQMRGHYWWNQ